jgi:hypothetical protein
MNRATAAWMSGRPLVTVVVFGLFAVTTYLRVAAPAAAATAGCADILFVGVRGSAVCTNMEQASSCQVVSIASPNGQRR